MAYTDRATVIAEFKNLTVANTGTMVTEAELDAYIAQESSRIDAAIGGRYQTPIVALDSPKAFEILKRIATAMVARRVRKKLETKLATQTTQAQSETNFASSGIDPLKELEMIRDQELYLLDAFQRDVLVRPVSFDLNDNGPQWSSGEDQW